MAWWHRTSVHVAVLVAWSIFLFVYGIHQGDLYRTEGLRAIIGKEMYQTGDWVVPRLYGEPILTKPPMFYWAIAAVGTFFGEVTVWSSRLPAALAGLIAVLIVYFAVRRYREGALFVAMYLPVSVMWLEKASSSEIDMMLVMWVLGAWACFLRVMESFSEPVSQRIGLFWWIAALVCVAGGVLTKWMGFLFFYVMVIPMLAWYRQLWRLVHWHHLLAALIGAILVWCWMGAVVFKLGWSNVVEMLWKEGAPRVLHAESTNRHLWLETALHPLKVLGIALPWSLLAIYDSWRRSNKTADFSSSSFLERSLWCWAVVGTLIMTAFPDHNIRQSYSLVPAWTLLGALAALRLAGQRTSPARWWRVSRQTLIAGLVLWCMVKIVHVEMLIPARYAKRPDLEVQAAIIQDFVPEEVTLYLSQVKDECLMFTCSRRVRRVAGWLYPTPFELEKQYVETKASRGPDKAGKPRTISTDTCWCILTEAERAKFPLPVSVEKRLLNAQGEPLILCQCPSGITASLR